MRHEEGAGSRNVALYFFIALALAGILAVAASSRGVLSERGIGGSGGTGAATHLSTGASVPLHGGTTEPPSRSESYWQRRARRAEAKNVKLRARLSRGAEGVIAWTLDALLVKDCEGGWTSATGNGYFGGMQMDIDFQRSYGQRLLQAKGPAHRWTRVEQLVVAYRGWLKRGWAAWADCSAKAGLR